MLVRRLLVAALAVVGLALLLVGAGLRTVWLPDDQVSASADLSGAPVALTAPGVLELRPGPVAVRLEGEGEVHLARMREEDALAWVGDSPHVTVTGLQEASALATETAPGETAVPDPAGSIMWLDGASGDGEATLTWDDRPGRYLLVAAGDGTTAPQRLTLTWPQEVSTPWAVPLQVGGAVVLVVALGLTVLLVLGARRRAAAGASAAETPAPTDPTDPTTSDARTPGNEVHR